MRAVYLITCSRRKLSTKAEAKDLYVSPSFKAARNIAESLGDIWFILSAKYGLIRPDTELEPYDCSLSSLNEIECRSWASKVVESLIPYLLNDDRIIIIGDDSYSKYIAPLLHHTGFDVYIPLLGKSNDQRMFWMKGILNRSKTAENLNRFYRMISDLRDGLGGMRPFSECHGRNGWPERGVYFLFEDGEIRYSFPSTLRVVRVGTHAISNGSKSTLWQRLKSHKGVTNGGGSHRSSVLRFYIGASMMMRSKGTIDIPSWGDIQQPDKSAIHDEKDLEHRVTEYIDEMKVLWLSINDPPSSISDRAYIERNTIALLAGKLGPIDLPSKEWIGNYCPNTTVKWSGLWNVDFVGDNYDERFLDVFEQYVHITLGNRKEPEGSIAPYKWFKCKKSANIQGQEKLF